MPHSWWPSATLATLHERAATVAALRAYFAAQQICEVTTPALLSYASSEPTLENLTLTNDIGGAPERWYLRTSPESAMKRLLSSGSGDIYQLGPVFRADERGRHHLLEFTLLEWYRVGFTLAQLMDDVESLLRAAGFARGVTRVTYDDLFTTHFGVSPHGLASTELAGLVARQPVELAPADRDDRALLFDCLYACVLEPALRAMGAVLLYDFPVELRAYARLSSSEPVVAARFELVVDGLELANGYHEILDADEQARCFEQDNATRLRRGLPRITPDQRWLAALTAGMPPCAGVALGIERLLMILHAYRHIDEVTSFADELDSSAE